MVRVQECHIAAVVEGLNSGLVGGLVGPRMGSGLEQRLVGVGKYGVGLGVSYGVGFGPVVRCIDQEEPMCCWIGTEQEQKID